MSIRDWTKRDWITGTVVIGLFACIPFGIVMALYTNNPTWLVFCATAFIFMS